MLPGAGVTGSGALGTNVLGPGDVPPGGGAKLGATVAPGIGVSEGESTGAPLGAVTIGAATPSEL